MYLRRRIRPRTRAHGLDCRSHRFIRASQPESTYCSQIPVPKRRLRSCLPPPVCRLVWVAVGRGAVDTPRNVPAVGKQATDNHALRAQFSRVAYATRYDIRGVATYIRASVVLRVRFEGVGILSIALAARDSSRLCWGV